MFASAFPYFEADAELGVIVDTFFCTKIKKFTIVNFFSLDTYSDPMCSRNVGVLRASALLIAISLALSWQQPLNPGSGRALSSSLADLLSASDFCFGFRLVSFSVGFLVCVLIFSRFALPLIV